ncbi:hypothetical protein KAJ02_10150, partial [Candidatus Bipolaricaulota bacterium]|nr:hypothetical protein [Candidatus Bipolaricaulota bacterium]
ESNLALRQQLVRDHGASARRIAGLDPKEMTAWCGRNYMGPAVAGPFLSRNREIYHIQAVV